MDRVTSYRRIVGAALFAASGLSLAAPDVRAEDGDLRKLDQRPALMARSRALSKPVQAPAPQAAPAPVPSPKPRGDDGARPADQRGQR